MSIATEATRPEFQYTPLKSTQTIRLIQFLSGPALRCRMRTYKLADAPPYVALSYTWGSPIFAKCLEVNEHTLRIKKNLHEAVTQLHHYAKDRLFLFWADSICVNQQDLKERSEQVQLMSMIYHRAKTVLIWLGPIANNIELAIDQMIDWEKYFEHMRGQTGRDYLMEMGSRIIASDPRLLGKPCAAHDRVFKGLRELCSQKWWTRAWIVQECMANLGSTKLCCGNRIVSWETMQLVFSIVGHTQRYRQKAAAEGLFEGNHYALDSFRRMKESGYTYTLLDVLGFLQRFECEDPRDKIYAAFGLVEHIGLPPDYTRTWPDVYQDMAAALLGTSGDHNLDFLERVNLQSNDNASNPSGAVVLPSWVPDWTVSSDRCPFSKYSYLYSGIPTKHGLYNATRSTKAKGYISGQRLHLWGSTIDAITQVMDAVTSKHDFDFTVEERWRPIAADLTYVGGGTLLQAYQHTLTADVRTYMIEDDYIKRRGGRVDWAELSVDGQGLNFEQRERLLQQRADIKIATCRRRLIETNQGYIGLGPENCEVGDQVCVLYGGQVLYILREYGIHEYRFVGECYLHGMMDGEALQHKDFFEREIVLV